MTGILESLQQLQLHRRTSKLQNLYYYLKNLVRDDLIISRMSNNAHN